MNAPSRQLGADWPALFAAGDAQARGDSWTELASDAARHSELVRDMVALQAVVSPATELAR